jgi:hypothetical protein
MTNWLRLGEQHCFHALKPHTMLPIQTNDFNGLPGAEAIRAGLEDFAAGRESVESLLIQIGAPRLSWLGITLSKQIDLDADRRLYRLLAAQHGDGAHSQFNSLIRQLVSFERALEQRLGARQRAMNSTP